MHLPHYQKDELKIYFLKAIIKNAELYLLFFDQNQYFSWLLPNYPHVFLNFLKDVMFLLGSMLLYIFTDYHLIPLCKILITNFRLISSINPFFKSLFLIILLDNILQRSIEYRESYLEWQWLGVKLLKFFIKTILVHR